MARPRKIKTIRQMEQVVESYFKSCEPVFMRDEDGAIMLDGRGRPKCEEVGRPPTMSGLARALGLSRSALLYYAQREEFADTVARARARVEEYAEERLYDREGVQGAKFTLMNNFGWREKLDTVNRDGGTYSDEEAKEKLAQYGREH